MRTMEAVDVSKNVDEVLRYIEKNRKPILVLKDGKKHCMMLPAARAKKVRTDSGQAPVG
jgi:PHD/YefM family antitoxin component YafN of YafNO toxin-antitoxin module